MKKLVLFLIICIIATNFCYAQEREVLISESFTPYNVGSKIAVAANSAGNYWWTTWSNSPGSTEDGIVANYGGNKCGHLTYGNDQVLLLGDEDTGNYDLEFDILVPQGKNGYFNILHHFAGTNSTWAMQCYLHLTNDGQNTTQAPGHGTIHAGSNNTADIACVYDAWMHFRLNVDTDQDIARYYYTAPGANEILVCSWQWSLDSFGENVVGRTLSAMDFFPPLNASTSEYYLDNFVFNRIGGTTAPALTITPISIERTLQEDQMTTVPITISNSGNSMGDWNGWVDFGQGGTGSQTADLYYHNGEVASGIGSSSAYTREMAIRLPASVYAGSALGMRIVSAQYYIYDNYQSADHNYIFRIYGQGMNEQPGELLAQKTVYSTASGTWITATFNQTVFMTGQTMWVSVQLEQVAGEYPMSMDGGEYGEESDGNWLSTNGNSFSHCYSAGSFGGAWLISVNCQGTHVPGTWASINNSHGSIYGGDSEVVMLSLNSIGMAQGSYYSNIVFETNDNNLSHVEIPVTLFVNNGATYYTITVSADPSNGGTVTGGGTYASGSTCTLHAVANSGYSFVKWTRNGTQVSTNPDYGFTVTGNASYVAHFQQSTQNYTITVSADPSNGGTVTGGGTYASGSTCTLHAVANSGYSFVKWTRNGTQVSTNPDYSFTVTGNASYVAHFQQSTQNYTITVSANPTNGGTVTGGGTYAEGSTCTLAASPNNGYVFERWTEDGIQVSTNPVYSFVVTESASYIAHFKQSASQYTVTAMAVPANGGSVSGGGTYEQGATCTLSATANNDFSFVNWTDANGNQVSVNSSYSFTVTSNVIYIANFTQSVDYYNIVARAEPYAGGSVTGAGVYVGGSVCTLMATPFTGFSFVCWKDDGAVVSTEALYSFIVSGDRSLVAEFSQEQSYTITASSGANGIISPEGVVTVANGEDKTFAMIPDVGCSVGRVVVDGVDVGPVESYTFRNVSENHTIHVQFSGLGLDEGDYSSNLRVYPNPAKGNVNIEGTAIKRVTIFNLLGVREGIVEVNDDHMMLNIEGLVQGTYLLKIEYVDGSIGYSHLLVVR